MSEFLNGKDYGDYFAELENRVSKSEHPPTEINKIKKSTAPTVLKKPSSKRRRAILRRRVVIAGAAIILIGSILLISSAFKPDTKQNRTVPKYSNDKISSQANKPIENQIKNLYAEFDDSTAGIGEEFKSSGIIVVNNSTKRVVAARNAKDRLFPASTTKIMTLLVAVEQIKNFNDTFTMTYEITDPLYREDATVAGFSSGEEIDMTDLLYGVILPSGGDACIGLAEKLCGSEKEFVKLMNKRAESMGLKNTNFENSTGLHSSNHYTTAEDLSVILSETIKNDMCREILSTYQYTTAKTPQHPDGILLSSTLFSHMYGTEPEGADILGGKTGFTSEAGYCIASFGKSDGGTEYICVTLSGEGKWPTFYDQIDLYTAYAK